MRTIEVSLGSRSYPVHIAPGLLDQSGPLVREHLGEAAVAVVTDDRVGPIYLERVLASLRGSGLRAVSVTLPHGEKTKCLEQAAELYRFFAEHHITRRDAVLALGGGVMGDLGGFAAATWLRGVRFVQLPTSLLAQVDSSVGGKVAVDLPEGKNLVGAFHQPSLVLCDPRALDTLPEEFWRDGLGEVAKYGAIRDENLFRLLEEAAPLGRQGLMVRMDEILGRCIACKADIVSRDELDTGERAILNFGHSLGHAVETCQRYSGLHHGEAVAAGMAAITRLSEKQGLTEPGTAARIEALLTALGLPARLPEIPADQLRAALRRDKKAEGDGLRVVLLERIGRCFTRLVQPETFFADLG
ncbi:MAG: 3-dehydroquinate synthase [Clostridia bacterium]|nr:3-dehydroquinate synthase [Clostridia bacterium]